MNFYRLLLTICLVFSISASRAQYFHWYKQFGNEEIDHAGEVTRDLDGNIYLGGKFEETVDFDPGPETYDLTSYGSDGNVYLSKLDPNGHFLWARNWGNGYSEFIRDVETDSNGNVYVIGEFKGTVDFDPGPDELIFTSLNNRYDVYISKFSGEGELIWTRVFGDSRGDSGYELELDSVENIYATGDFEGEVQVQILTDTVTLGIPLEDTGFLLKMAPSGDVIQATTIPKWTGSFKISESGFIYLTGNFSGLVDFDPGLDTFELNGNNDFEVFLMKLDLDANFHWAIDFCQGNENHLVNLQLDNAENVYICGKFDSYSIFDPSLTTYQLVPEGEGDVFVSSYTKDGDYRWVKSWGDEEEDVPYAIKLDSSANVYVCGMFEGTVDFDPGPDSVLISSYYVSGPAYEDMFLSVLDSAGNLVWVQTYGNHSTEYCRAMHVTEGGEIVAAINYAGQNLDLDHGPDSAIVGSVGWYDVFVLKLGICQPVFSNFSDLICTSYISPSGLYEWNTPGSYLDVMPSSMGCDSIVEVALSSAITNSEIQALECSHYTSPSGNYIWTDSGNYTDTLTNVYGCDSLIAVQLTIGNNSRFIGAFACNEYISPDGNEIWTSNGTYTDTLQNSLGCDSVITINLAFTEVDTSISIDGVTITSNNSNVVYQWLDCNNNYAVILGETDQSFTPMENGNYAVQLTQSGCIDTSACITISSIGIFENGFGGNMKVYPNPTSGHFLVELNQHYEFLTVEILDLTGKSILSKDYTNHQRLDLELEVPAGVYILIIQSEDKVAKIRIDKTF